MAERNRKASWGLTGEDHKARLRYMDCIYRCRVRVVLGISLWLHCVQEGWGHPSLEAQLDWLGSSRSWHVSAGWLSSEQPCVGRIWRVSPQTPMGAEGGFCSLGGLLLI